MEGVAEDTGRFLFLFLFFIGRSSQLQKSLGNFRSKTMINSSLLEFVTPENVFSAIGEVVLCIGKLGLGLL